MHATWTTILTIVQPSSSRHAGQPPRADDALDERSCRPPTSPSTPDRPITRDSVGPGCRRRARDRPCCGGAAGGTWRTKSRPGTTSGRFARMATSRFAVRDRKTRLWQVVVDQRPQRVVDRRADDVGGRAPRSNQRRWPTSTASRTGRAPGRASTARSPARSGQRAQLGMRREHLPAARRVRLTVGDVDVVGRRHRDKVVCRGGASADLAAATVGVECGSGRTSV